MNTLKEQLKNSYLTWLKETIKLSDLNGAIEITTPFMDRHNDHLLIYANSTGTKINLTDDGYIINDLLMSGCDINSTNKRKEILQSILNGYGVQRSAQDELYVETTIQQFPKKKHMLIQAMLAVNDMFMTSNLNIQNIFLEEVENFFRQHQIRYSEHITITGKSGFANKYDFVIPRSHNSPERLISTINNPSIDKAKSILFAWGETKDTRKEGTKHYAILNDSHKSVNSDIISAFDEYNIQPIKWNERAKYIDELAS
ncbi:MAG: DUF1829 domain-containing protein [Paenibacillaceae bacterium]